MQFARKLTEFSVPSTPVNAAVRTPKQKTPHGAGLFTTGGAERIILTNGYIPLKVEF